MNFLLFVHWLLLWRWFFKDSCVNINLMASVEIWIWFTIFTFYTRNLVLSVIANVLPYFSFWTWRFPLFFIQEPNFKPDKICWPFNITFIIRKSLVPNMGCTVVVQQLWISLCSLLNCKMWFCVILMQNLILWMQVSFFTYICEFCLPSTFKFQKFFYSLLLFNSDLGLTVAKYCHAVN